MSIFGKFKYKESTGCYLISVQGQVIMLSKNQPLVIGRERGNDVVLNNFLVSRKHALIRWSKDHFIIQDLRSQNGTFVNNVRVKKENLQHGDNIKIGGYEFVFRTGSKEEMENLLMEEKMRVANQNTAASFLGLGFSEEGFVGNLKSLNLAELVQMLNQSLKSGLLSIDTIGKKGNKAKLYFRNGEIVHAIQEDLFGLEAVIPILQLKEGKFNFQINMEAPQKTINQSTIGILLEAHRQDDEKSKKK